MIRLPRKRMQVVHQIEAAECGAACLAMVLAHYRRWITLEEARARCATSRDGVDAASLLLAARSYGLEARAYRREPEELHALPLPQIVHWNFDHFVVLERIGGDRYELCDPATGRRAVSKDEFSDSFTGLTIAAVPGADFVAGGRPPSVTATLLEHVRSSKDALFVLFGLGFFVALPAILLSGCLGIFVDYVAGAGQNRWLPYLLLGLVAVAGIQGGLALVQNRIVAALVAKVATCSATNGFWHSLFLPLAFYAQRSAGEIVSRLQLGSQIGGTISGPLAAIPPNVAIVGLYMAVLWLYDPVIALVALALSVATFVALYRISRKVAEANRACQIAESRADGLAVASISLLETFKWMGRERLMIDRWSAAEDAALTGEQRLGVVRAVGQRLPDAFAGLLASAALVIGALRALEGDLSIGSLVAIQILIGLLKEPIVESVTGLCQLQESAGALMRLDDLQRHPMAPAFARAGDAASEGAQDGPLVLHAVSFGHAPGHTLLDNVEFTLHPGEIVALTGASGCGKSTLARIASGLVEPTAGRVTLGGVALSDWPQEELRRHLVYVGQTPSVFSGDIAENISLYDQGLDLGDIVEQARAVGLHDALARHRGGYGTRISPDSGGISGGEQQRLALVRAMIARPRFLVLDETTSALDLVSEKTVLEALRESGAGVLIVTHRRGTEKRCDRVMTIRAGKLMAVSRPAGARAATGNGRDDPAQALCAAS
jgi:ABC-type bacteriocin/lantibiotic exporter with double-glycine peptidase domain